MNVANSKLNSLRNRSKTLAVLAGLLFVMAATVGSLALCSCAHTEKGLARETEIHNVASNTIAVLQPVVQAAPAPVNTILGTVFAGLSGLLAVWATHIHRSVSELKKSNGNAVVTPPRKPPAGRFPGWRNEQGYIKILFTAPGSRQLVYLHRLVIWHFGALGDLSRLDVHHRNGDPADNRPENLEILSHSEHSHQRAATSRRVQACVVCGKIFFPAENPRPHSPGHHCSNACALVTARRRRWARGAGNCLQ